MSMRHQEHMLPCTYLRFKPINYLSRTSSHLIQTFTAGHVDWDTAARRENNHPIPGQFIDAQGPWAVDPQFPVVP